MIKPEWRWVAARKRDFAKTFWKMATTAGLSQNQEGIFGSENLSSAYLEPVTSEEEVDYSKVYALFTFIASMEGQISVLKGEPLDLLDDSNSYWYAISMSI